MEEMLLASGVNARDSFRVRYVHAVYTIVALLSSESRGHLECLKAAS